MAIMRKPSETSEDECNAILNEIENGRPIESVAKRHELTKSGLYKHLRLKYPDEYRASMDARADTLAERMMMIAANKKVDVARARNMINSIQFTLSRRHSNLYGDKQEITKIDKGSQVPIINITLSAPESTVAIEGEVIDAKPLPSNDKDTA